MPGCSVCTRDSLVQGSVWFRALEADRPEIEPSSMFLIFYMTLDRSIIFSDVNFLFIKWT